MRFKKIIFIFVICLISNGLNAQIYKKYKSESYWGITGGMTGSMVFFKPAVDQSYLTGINTGIVFRHNSEKNLGVQAELNFAERGWLESDGTSELYARRLQYIEVPFLTHIYMGNQTRFFINFGPKIAYLIGEKELTNSFTNSTEIQHTTNIQNKFEYGLAVGFGLLTKIKKQVIQLDLRGAYSLSDIYSNAKRDYFDNSNNIYVSANLGWLIKTR